MFCKLIIIHSSILHVFIQSNLLQLVLFFKISWSFFYIYFYLSTQCGVRSKIVLFSCLAPTITQPAQTHDEALSMAEKPVRRRQVSSSLPTSKQERDA